MKILVIGNGFDLDHNLPTSYKDFLAFCELVLGKQENPPFEPPQNIDNKLLVLYDRLEKANKANDFLNLIKTNLILYFIKKQKGNNWIDFESDIKDLVDIFSGLEKEYYAQNSKSYIMEFKHKAFDLCKSLHINVFQKDAFETYKIDEKGLNVIYESLRNYVEKLTKALELYISEIINKEELEFFSPDILEFNPNRVISFNYSNTFERLYLQSSLAKNVDYIHGKADYDTVKSNIVLGITSNHTVESNYITFEKYYQRITKRTGAQYREWLKNKNETIEVVFFGHSLDSADKDILIDLIEHEKSYIKIFYHSDSSYKTIVENLNIVLGKEKLIEYVYGNKPKILFVSQQKACDKSSKGWEITNDIADIKNLHLRPNYDIQVFVEKITKKINNMDTNYFYNQKSLISFYDALSKQKLNNIFPLQTASAIAKELDFDTSNGMLVEYSIESWTAIDQFNEKSYSVSTQKFIDEINKINRVRFQETPNHNLISLISDLKSTKEKAEITPIILKIINEPLLFENKKNLDYLM